MQSSLELHECFKVHWNVLFALTTYVCPTPDTGFLDHRDGLHNVPRPETLPLQDTFAPLSALLLPRTTVCAPSASAHLCGLAPTVQLPLNDRAFFRSPVGEHCVSAASCEGALQQWKKAGKQQQQTVRGLQLHSCPSVLQVPAVEAASLLHHCLSSATCTAKKQPAQYSRQPLGP